ncbi:type II/IV secretion system ATPase subunit [Candidatus Bathyarchaeota archaeon]|nr:type II/IV secretion system ATPase subunit [Candidatus Bathyarchaeota archaeon]
MGLLEKIRKKNQKVEDIIPEVIEKKPEENYQVEENQKFEVKKVGFLEKLFNRTQKEFEDIGIVIEKPKPEYHIVDDYYIKEPFSKINIFKSDDLGEGLYYYAIEEPLDFNENEVFQKLIKILSKELEPPTEEDIAPEKYVLSQAKLLVTKYEKSLGTLNDRSWDKIFYYVVRDLAGYGPLDAVMHDPQIEDISCNGLNSPVYVWHRNYESIPTNMKFTDAQILNDFIIKLAHKSTKHISSAQPLLDGMLPEKHRLAATFMKEVSTKGSTFCIRKFRADPLSIIDLIKLGTLNERMAAYFWMILEYKMSFMILGGTGAGKTSMLNGILSLMSGNDKIVTVEEVPELSPPATNWTQLNTRQSFQLGSDSAKNITLFDLIKVSLRYRPDYIIVGEVRGEEAYTLFQALATGHGGLCTMHADSLDSAIKRLTSPPMNVAEVYIPLMNSALHIQRVKIPNNEGIVKFGRRIRTIWEIEDHEKYREISKWEPSTDTFMTKIEDSLLLRKVAQVSGMPLETIIEEFDKREQFIKDLLKAEIRDQKEVSFKILSYLCDDGTKVCGDESVDADIESIDTLDQQKTEVISELDSTTPNINGSEIGLQKIDGIGDNKD